MACGKAMNLEYEREQTQDANIQQCLDDIHYIRETTTCIIHQLHERIENLEINDAYLMDWRVKHDNEKARRHALAGGGKRSQAVAMKPYVITKKKR